MLIRRKKKNIKVIIMIILLIVLFGVISGKIDYNRINNKKTPIFVISNTDNKDYIIYYGLGYKIIKSKNKSSVADETSRTDRYYKADISDNYVVFGLWVDKLKPPDNNTKAKDDKVSFDVARIDIVKTENCDNKAKLYYKEKTKNIYTYCLDKIIITNKKDSLELKEYIKKDSSIIDIILVNFTKKHDWKYKDDTILFAGSDFNILKCYTSKGNKDIYIGDKSMGYEKGFCK